MSSQPNDSSTAPTKVSAIFLILLKRKFPFKDYRLSNIFFCSLFKSRDSQGLIPVTVKQISEASHSGDEKSNFSINGVDLTNV